MGTVAIRSGEAAVRTRTAPLLVALSVVLILAAVEPGSGRTMSFPANVDPTLVRAAMVSPDATMSVIVRETVPSSDGAEGRVRALGGAVTHELPIIRGFSARLTARAALDLAASPDVANVWADAPVDMSAETTQWLNMQDPNDVWQQAIRAPRARRNGWDGSGVTVALLDTGVNDVADLGSRVVARVDFTAERDGLDHYGHGTHMAGIIAGDGTMSNGAWMGVAPGANIVSVKVAGADGSTDVSVVIAGLQWTWSHRAQYNIKVLNLSFGTDARQRYLVDPLDYAVEQLWFSGIFVSVAAGNRGSASATINKPGDDPFVETVGAADLNDTVDARDDTLADFSSRGPTQDGFSKPDVVAPGVTIVSLRAVGSTIDERFPAARVGSGYFKGTGTSQATAVVSGVAALMFQAQRNLTPDVAKSTLRYTGDRTHSGQFGGNTTMIDAYDATDSAGSWEYRWVPANLRLVPSTGVGSIERSRGSYHVYADLPGDGLGADDADGRLDLVTGEIDALGNSWTNLGWTNLGWTNLGWTNAGWTNTGWSNTGWTNLGWTNTGWSNAGWSGLSWSNLGWTNVGWANTGWSGLVSGWSGDAWS